MNRIPILLIFLLVSFGQSTGLAETPDPKTVRPPSVSEATKYPKTVSTDKATFIVYPPQIEVWKDYLKIDAWVAVKATHKSKDTSYFGSLHILAETQADFETRTVVISNFTISETHFQGAGEDLSRELGEEARRAIRKDPLVVPLDLLLASTERGKARVKEAVVNLSPPKIFYSEEPAILVLLDGEPVLSPIEGTDLLFAVNTNWDLFFDKPSSTYYLLNKKTWLMATDFNGPWTPPLKMPKSFFKLPDDENWKAVRKTLSGRPGGKNNPKVFSSTQPAELILTEGKPKHTPIKGTKLLYVTNTENDLFFANDSHYYYLVSGRWFKAEKLNGPWLTAEKLPEDFSKIPSGHPRADVLVSVPETPEARLAVLQAQIPQQAEVKRKDAKATVHYNGEPEFEPIEGTSMARAVNTNSDIVQVRNTYYLCHQGVWFFSKNPVGPWTVADSIPEEIYTIPSSSPIFHVTYVYIYDSTPDVVVVGYTSGYHQVYVYSGVVVYGTGYYYSPYIWYGSYYPVYYPYHYSYGVGAYYNTYTGAYGRGASVYGPYGGAGRYAAYNPNTGTYARAGAVWGPEGGTWAARAYNPYTGTGAATRQSANSYAQWGESVARRGDEWIRTGHYTDSKGTRAGFETSKGGKGVGFRGEEGSGGIARSGEGDLYVGKDGEVFKRTDEGWHKNDKGNWNPVEPTGERKETFKDAASERSRTDRDFSRSYAQDMGRLDRDARIRSEANRRQQSYQTQRSSGNFNQNRGMVRRGGGGFRR